MPATTTATTTLLGLELPAEVLVQGAVSGLAYGLAAVGLVLAFRASRVVNFAHGQIGAISAIGLGLLVREAGVPYWIAFVAALAIGAGLAALVEVVVVRRLRGTPPLMTLVGTLGVAQVLLFGGAALSTSLSNAQSFPQPPGLPTVELGALQLGPASLAILVLGPVTVVAIALLLRLTSTGRMLRASADNADGARLLGVGADRLRTATWAIAGALAALTATLVLPAGAAPTTEALGPGLLLRALAAAVIAGMSSLPVALGTGVLLGIVDQVGAWNSPGAGGADLVMLVIVLLALLLRPGIGGRAGDRGSWAAFGRWPRLPEAVRAVPLVRLIGPVVAVVALAVAAALPLVLDAGQETAATTVVCYAIAGLGVWVVTGLGGQLALGQFGLAGIGAMFAAVVAQQAGSPVLGLLAAIVAGAAAAVLIGLPALRIQGLMLPVSTLAFALAAQQWLLPQPWALGEGRSVPSITGSDEPWAQYLVALGGLVVAVLLARNLARTGFGRRLVAVRDNDLAARAFGVNATVVRLQALGVSGALAGAAGAFLGMALLRSSATAFPVSASIDTVAVTVLGGLQTVAGPILGALYIAGIPSFVDLSSAALAATAFGWLLLVLLVPGGLGALALRLRDGTVRVLLALAGQPRDLQRVEPPEVGLSGTAALGEQDGPGGASLAVEGVAKRFGGVRAVDGVTLAVAPGEVLGLIGPNGAGKTTLFDLLSGAQRPDDGRVLLDGRDVTWLTPEQRAGRGLVRSFQDAALFPTMTVRDVVLLGTERTRPTPLLAALGGAWRSERARGRRADELLALMGLTRFAETRVDELSTGMRRICELACVLAMEPRVLLLDEPSAGIAQREVEALGALLRRVRDALGVTMVVIEHDLPLVFGLSDRVVAIVEGQVLTEGTPREIADDPRVAEAVLGATQVPA